jgi:hypothetical protein
VYGRPVKSVRIPGIGAAGVAVVILLADRSTPEYRKATAAKGAIVFEVTATGAVTPVGEVEVGSRISGRISDLRVDFNDAVRREQAALEQAATFAVDAYPGRNFAGEVVQTRKAPEDVQGVVACTVVITANNADRAAVSIRSRRSGSNRLEHLRPSRTRLRPGFIAETRGRRPAWRSHSGSIRQRNRCRLWRSRPARAASGRRCSAACRSTG